MICNHTACLYFAFCCTVKRMVMDHICLQFFFEFTKVMGEGCKVLTLSILLKYSKITYLKIRWVGWVPQTYKFILVLICSVFKYHNTNIWHKKNKSKLRKNVLSRHGYEARTRLSKQAHEVCSCKVFKIENWLYFPKIISFHLSNQTNHRNVHSISKKWSIQNLFRKLKTL